MSNPAPGDREALRREIQAAIAAGRELDPSMDEHLADSAMDRYLKEEAARGKAVSPGPQPVMPQQHPLPMAIENMFRGMISLAIVGGVIAAVVFGFSQWWMFFLIWPLLGGMWGWRGRRYRYAYGYHPAIGSSSSGRVDADDEELRRQEKATKRRLRIHQMEAEIKRLKTEDDD